MMCGALSRQGRGCRSSRDGHLGSEGGPAEGAEVPQAVLRELRDVVHAPAVLQIQRCTPPVAAATAAQQTRILQNEAHVRQQ